MGLGGPIGGLVTDWYVSEAQKVSRRLILYRLGWRWAFLIQVPFFAVSFVLTSYNLRYVTSVGFSDFVSESVFICLQGRGKSTKDILKRIDYAGSLSLLISVGSCLFFLSTRYNAILPVSEL